MPPSGVEMWMEAAISIRELTEDGHASRNKPIDLVVTTR
jgi:Zn ribbon nucleic-acid-binding protein